jgi:hypothetical protein
MSKLSKSTPSTARHGCPESRFCRSTQFLSSLSRHQGVSAQSAQSLRAYDYNDGESPRSPNPSPRIQVLILTLDTGRSAFRGGRLTLLHFGISPLGLVLVRGLLTAEYRPYSERTPNTEACILYYRRSTLSFENLPSPRQV